MEQEEQSKEEQSKEEQDQQTERSKEEQAKETEQANEEQGTETLQWQGNGNGENQKSEWRANLKGFFDDIKREDNAFADHVVVVKRFYADAVSPALAEVARELELYGRECETGEDAGRVYIIVRAVKEKVEFQYAVVVETKIEGLTPYIHCWYEEPPKDEAPIAGDEQESGAQEDDAHSQAEQGGGKDDQEKGNDKEEDGDKKGDDEKGDDEKGGDDKAAGTPKRTKTIEPFANWGPGRELQSITQEEIINDFLNHYKNAVARLRAPLHQAHKD